MLGSTLEGFGLVIPELMVSESSILVHDSNYFEWLVVSQGFLVEAKGSGPLTKTLQRFMADSHRPVFMKNSKSAIDRYGWSVLKGKCLMMYKSR